MWNDFSISILEFIFYKFFNSMELKLCANVDHQRLSKIVMNWIPSKIQFLEISMEPNLAIAWWKLFDRSHWQTFELSTLFQTQEEKKLVRELTDLCPKQIDLFRWNSWLHTTLGLIHKNHLKLFSFFFESTETGYLYLSRN